jgi:hypothetical protein
LAADPPVAEWARRRVEEGLVKPLSERQGRKFSRSRPPPVERRVRVLSTTESVDKSGRKFVSFAVDVRFGEEWRDDIAGCVYRGSGDIFVRKGESFRPAAFLLGKDVAPVAGVCETAPPPRA